MIQNVVMRYDSGSMVHTHLFMIPISQPLKLHLMPFSSAAAKVCTHCCVKYIKIVLCVFELLIQNLCCRGLARPEIGWFWFGCREKTAVFISVLSFTLPLVLCSIKTDLN